ncbi:MAG: hypothetical protein HY549_08880 [Elusimicrobia bacterium]|nr:hypothetical protein [Elusimicrobiota bacterium]
MIGIATFLAVILGSASGNAAEVALLSEPNLILDQIAQGFKATFPGPVESFTLNPQSEEAFWQRVKQSYPKLIVALGPAAAAQAKERFAPEIPVLFAGVVGAQLSKLEGERVEGIPMTLPVKEQWASAQKALPDLKRMGVLYSPQDSREKFSEARDAARALSIELVAAPCATPEALSEALSRIEGRVDALWIPLDPVVANKLAFKGLVSFSLKNRLPLIVPSISLLRGGGLLSLSMSYQEIGKQLGLQAQAILSGGSARVRLSASDADVAVNMNTAKALGRDFPAEFMKTVKIKVE